MGSRSNFGSVGACGLLALCVATTASAHLEIQAGKSPFVDINGAFRGGHSSWGVVLPAGGGTDGYLRVCEESYDPNPVSRATASFSFLRTDGSILIGGFLGTFVSADAGCTLQSVAAPLADHAASVLVRAGTKLFVGTFDIQSANGIYVSDDDGDTWRVSLAPVPDVSFFQIAVSPDGARLIASGNLLTDAGTKPAVFVSVDAGETWQEISAPYAGFTLVRATTFDADGQTALFGGLQPSGDVQVGHVLRAAPPYTAPETIGTFPSEVTHIAVDGAARLALTPLRSELYRQAAPDAPFVLATDLNAASPEPPGPSDCVFARPGGGFLGCARQSLGSLGLFVESDDGTTWRTRLAFEDVGYRICPAGTPGNAKCASYFESACFNGADDDVDGLSDCEDSDCAEPCEAREGEGEPAEGEGDAGPDGPDGKEGEGEEESSTCETAGGPTSALAGLTLVLLMRARRRRASA